MSRRKLNGDHCQCSACGEHFNSTKAFDKHRNGPYSARICLAADEMLAKGMAKISTGWWISKKKDVSYSHALSRIGDRPEALPWLRPAREAEAACRA